MSNLFNNRCYGLVIVKSKNSNFNADFSGLPRRLPDANGTIYATDKALKYAIRRYFVENEVDETVFVWKEFKKERKNKKIELKPLTLEKKYESVKKILYSEKKNIHPIEVLLKCIDVRCFGVTFAAAGHNVSICGPVQVSYGINRFQEENTVYSSQILSPYGREKKKQSGESESTGQSSIGSESKGLESHYVFDFVINPSNLKDHYNKLKNKKNIGLTINDIEKLKKALCKGVTNLNSTTKIGSENELVMFLKLEENSKLQLPTAKDLVLISEDKDKYQIDLKRVFEAWDIKDQEVDEFDLNLNQKGEKKGRKKKPSSNKNGGIENIELYYNKTLTRVLK